MSENYFLNRFQADEKGIAYPEPAPEPKICEYCGKNVYRLGAVSPISKRIFHWKHDFEPCNCPQAQKEQKDFRDNQERERAEMMRRRERDEFQKRVNDLFDQSQLGERFRQRTFENFIVTDQNQQSYETAFKYARDFEKYKKEGLGLIFSGGYGSGKTHLAAAIATNLLNKSIPVVFGNTISLLGKVKQAYDDEIRESEYQVLDLYSRVPLLVIDDLGKERPGEWVLEKLYFIINNRYENNLPVIITTNYQIDQLPEKLSTKRNLDTGAAIASRLWEMCRGVAMNCEDWRKNH